MSARPRPKPRPKPKVTSEPSTSATSLESSRTKSPASNDDDDLFLRHDPNRLLHNQKKSRDKSPLRDVKYFDNGGMDESPESKRRRKDLAPKRAKPLPSWTFQTRDPTAINVESDNDSSEPEILEDDAFKDVPSAPLPKPKLRERSITPPPQHLRYQVGNQVHELLDKLYDVDDDRELSPEMESQDIQLLPELAAIQNNARASSAAPEVADTRSVDLHIQWIAHPTHPQPWENALKSWDFNVPLNKPFGEIRRMLTGLPMATQPILRWQSRRLFDGGTPASLLAGSQLEIQAMTKPTNEYVEERHQLPPSSPGSDATGDHDGPSGSQEGSSTVVEKITLRLRTGPKDTRPTTVRVFPDATIQTVIETFLNKTGRAGVQGVSLQIDGDDLEMDSTVADADLEDGDLVEVAGIE